MYLKTPQSKQGERKMNVLFLNNDGEGFAKRIEIGSETRLDDFLVENIDGFNADNFVIRVNRQPAERTYVLQDGDRISASPRKIEGA